MKIAATALAACAPLLTVPDMNEPRLAISRARKLRRESTRSSLSSRSAGSVISATTRLPRVWSMFTVEDFLSEAKLDSRAKFSISGRWEAIHLQAAAVALLVMFWPAASPVVKLKRV